jgi:myo-inositol-1(or 4)-monophosphatase
MTGATPAEWGSVALAAARAGAAAITRVRDAGALDTATKSAAHDFVTAADKAAEDAVIATIRASFPDDAILGEESGSHPGTTATRWIVDPLDGTANVVYGRADHAVSIGVEHDGVIVAGAVLRPVNGEWGVAAGGELRVGRDDPGRPADGRPGVPLRGAITSQQALVCVSQPYPIPLRVRTLTILTGLIPELRALRMVGSAACDLLCVATGEADAYLAFGLAPWDTAGGQALVEAAGGIVVRIADRDFEVIVAGNSDIVADLEQRLRALGVGGRSR